MVCRKLLRMSGKLHYFNNLHAVLRVRSIFVVMSSTLVFSCFVRCLTLDFMRMSGAVRTGHLHFLRVSGFACVTQRTQGIQHSARQLPDRHTLAVWPCPAGQLPTIALLTGQATFFVRCTQPPLFPLSLPPLLQCTLYSEQLLMQLDNLVCSLCCSVFCLIPFSSCNRRWRLRE